MGMGWTTLGPMSEPASQPTNVKHWPPQVDRGDGTAFLKLPKPHPTPCPPVGEQSGNLRHTSRRPSVSMLPTYLSVHIPLLLWLPVWPSSAARAVRDRLDMFRTASHEESRQTCRSATLRSRVLDVLPRHFVRRARPFDRR